MGWCEVTSEKMRGGGLKVLGRHVENKLLREHGERSVGRVQEEVVDNLLADYIDEAGPGKVVEQVVGVRPAEIGCVMSGD